MGEGAELLGRKARLIERAGGGGVDVFTEYGEGAPQGEGLEGKDRLAAGTARGVAYELQVAAQKPLLDYVAGRRETSVVLGADI